MSREELIEKLRAYGIFADAMDAEIRQSMLERLADGILAGGEVSPIPLETEIGNEAEGGTILG